MNYTITTNDNILNKLVDKVFASTVGINPITNSDITIRFIDLENIGARLANLTHRNIYYIINTHETDYRKKVSFFMYKKPCVYEVTKSIIYGFGCTKEDCSSIYLGHVAHNPMNYFAYKLFTEPEDIDRLVRPRLNIFNWNLVELPLIDNWQSIGNVGCMSFDQFVYLRCLYTKNKNIAHKECAEVEKLTGLTTVEEAKALIGKLLLI